MAWFLAVHPSVCPLTFSCLTNKILIFDLILLKLAKIVCAVVRINPIKNEENLSNITGKGYSNALAYVTRRLIG